MASKQTQNTRKVALKSPIGDGEGAITELTLRKPSPGELRGLQIGALAAGDTNAIIRLVPRIAMEAVNEDQVAALALEDFTDCYQVLLGFLGN